MPVTKNRIIRLEIYPQPDSPDCYDVAITKEFEQYAEDIGAIEDRNHWPCDYIDWELAADSLKMDYFSVQFDGVEYWVRS